MDTTPRKRVLKSVLLHSLQRYRQTARLPEDAFESANADYATYLAQMADNYDLAPEEMHVQEKAGFSGYDMWSETYDLETENPVILGDDQRQLEFPFDDN